MFYNLIISREWSENPEGRDNYINLETIEHFTTILTENVLVAFGDDILISRVTLEFITLLTKLNETNFLVLQSHSLIRYSFRKLITPLVTQ